MPAQSPEALLLSALLNNSCVGDESHYGISASDFEGFGAEYNWLSAYEPSYGSQPSADIFCAQFPTFILSPHANVGSAAAMVADARNRRRITTAITDAAEQLGLNDAQGAYQTLLEAKPRLAAPKPVSLLTDTAHLDEWHVAPHCIEMPYPTLQRHTRGIRKGNLWFLAARPGQGKSAHLASIAKAAVLAGNRVLFYSIEMNSDEVRARFHAAMASDLDHKNGNRIYANLTMTNLLDRRVELGLYRTFHGELSERLKTVGGVLDVHTPVLGPVSPSVVATRASDYDLVLIDYVGLMAADGSGYGIDDWRVMAKISNSLKAIALSTPVGIICAAQINREGESGHVPPKVKNLSQSDALGQDGDVVLTMRSKPHDVATHFSLEKNRHGPSGIYFYTSFDPNRGRYSEISAEHVEDLVLNAEVMADNPTPLPKLRVVKAKGEL